MQLCINNCSICLNALKITNCFYFVSEKKSFTSHSCSGCRCFGPSMASAYNYHIKTIFFVTITGG